MYKNIIFCNNMIKNDEIRSIILKEGVYKGI